MILKTAQVDEHLIRFFCDSVRLEKMIEENFRFVPSSKPADLSVTLRDGYGAPFAGFDVEAKKTGHSVVYTRPDYRIESDADFKQADIRFHDRLALKHALMNLYSSFIVRRHWGLMIHSSCVIDGRTAHLFSGTSGAGKSTVAQLSRPRPLLSDEASLLKIAPDGVTVFNSPFRSDVSALSGGNPRPLASIQLLHQFPVNRRDRLDKASGLLHLIDKVFYWTQSQEEMLRVISILRQLTEQVPVYDLYFQKNDSFWELISDNRHCAKVE
ncbi:hypothetical protein [Sporolactobacillus sp. KGMB 08714]|uniref:hypothetical protein n=1 Tax=Sporolactobacillus sp. KGMB 08714 TaxID=3064704 RepID=UPI002FBEA972